MAEGSRAWAYARIRGGLGNLGNEIDQRRVSGSIGSDRGGLAEACRGPAQQTRSPGEESSGIGELDYPAEVVFTEWKRGGIPGVTGRNASR